MEKRSLLLVVVAVVGLLSSVSFAGGPLGPPMNVLEPGKWAFDIAYFHEKMDLWGCGDVSSLSAEPNGTDPNDWDWESGGSSLDKVRLRDFKTNTILASLDYGLCENWDVYLRLGVADAKADVSWWGDTTEDSADFGYGLAWQLGTNFTICRSGPWTFGGRMQIGAAYPGDWSQTRSGTWEEGDSNGVDTEKTTADLSWWQGLAYLGGTYQINDTLQGYAGLGWQTMQGTLDVDYSYTAYYDSSAVYQERADGSMKIKHASAIAVFGLAWKPPVDDARVGVELIVGEAGKFGFGITGAIPIP